MKKLFAILALTIPLIHAQAGTVEYSYTFNHVDEKNVQAMIYQIRSMYGQIVDFRNLGQISKKNLFSTANYPLPESELNKFQLSTENKDTIAVIKYKAQNCDNLKHIKEKLIESRLIVSSDYIDCKNNEFTAKIKQFP
jgi:hypothetical protein